MHHSAFSSFNRPFLALLLVPTMLFGCTGLNDLPVGIGALGGFTHDLALVEIEVIAKEGDGLNTPRDLAFHPDRDGELWIVNRGDEAGDESAVVLADVGTNDQEDTSFSSFGTQHFLAQPSGIAFAADGTFATSHETDEPTQGPMEAGGTPPDFMGPTLWSSDTNIFDGGHGGHLDMLHNSPNGMGIAWAGEDRDFWYFDGYHDSITLYKFNDDHGPGGSDHSDGVVERWVEGEVDRKSGVPSHMDYQANTALLYIADTGNNRIAVLDATSGERGGPIEPNYDFITQRYRDNADIWTHIDGTKIEEVEGIEDLSELEDMDMSIPPMKQPSGLAISDGVLYISDNKTSVLYAFTVDGVLIDWLDLGRAEGALMGIEVDKQGRIYIVDAEADEVIRLSPAPEETD